MKSVLSKGRAPITRPVDRNVVPGGGLILSGLVSLLLWAAVAGIIAIV